MRGRGDVEYDTIVGLLTGLSFDQRAQVSSLRSGFQRIQVFLPLLLVTPAQDENATMLF
jgi:hypothetical protein